MRQNCVALFFLSILTASCALCGVSALAAICHHRGQPDYAGGQSADDFRRCHCDSHG